MVPVRMSLSPFAMTGWFGQGDRGRPGARGAGQAWAAGSRPGAGGAGEGDPTGFVLTDAASGVPVSLSAVWQVFWLEGRPTLHAFPDRGPVARRGFRHLSQRRDRSRFARDSLFSVSAPDRSFGVGASKPPRSGSVKRFGGEGAEARDPGEFGWRGGVAGASLRGMWNERLDFLGQTDVCSRRNS